MRYIVLSEVVLCHEDESVSDAARRDGAYSEFQDPRAGAEGQGQHIDVDRLPAGIHEHQP